MSRIKCYIDGSVTDNTDPESDGGYGIVFLLDNAGKYISGHVPSPCTNNLAEFVSFREALKELKTKKPVDFYSDSMLVVMSFHHKRKRWELKKPHLQEIAKEINELLKDLDYTITHVKGHSTNYWNNEADRLAEIGRMFKELDKNYFIIK